MSKARVFVATTAVLLVSVPARAQVDGGTCPAVPSPPPAVTIAWDNVNAQLPNWYATPQALVIAENVLYYQNDSGGWPKNIDMTVRTAERDDRSMIDNDATTMQLTFLGSMVAATGCATYVNAFLKGLDFLLNAQYPNGGWPQVFPIEEDNYSRHITYNDGAMTNVLYLLKAVGTRLPKYAFVDAARADRAAAAVTRGIDCILRTQIVVDGVKTAWCAQHDAQTLAPATARSYELPSISGSEGAEVLRFLMTIDNPSPAVIEAVQGAAAWFQRAKLTGIRTERFVADNGEEDVRVVADPAAPPIWARFYEISTSVPFFCGRDGVKKATLAEIEQERRAGYAYYGNWPASVLSSAYPTWKARWITSAPDGGLPPADAAAGDGATPTDAGVAPADADVPDPSGPGTGTGGTGMPPGLAGSDAGCGCALAAKSARGGGPFALAGLLVVALSLARARRRRP